MKKIIFSVGMFLLLAGIANAQTTKKDSTKMKHIITTNKTTATGTKTTISNTTTVSPGITKTTTTTGIKRKHPKKKNPMVKKG